MNKRERILLFTLLGLVIVVGGWALYYYTFRKPMDALQGRLDVAHSTLVDRQQQLERSNIEMDKILERDPRLQVWSKISLPEAKLPPGKAITQQESSKHLTQVGVDYERYLSDLLRDNGFAPASINVTPKPVDSKSSPTIPGKGPIYTRLSFAVQGQATLAAIVRMLKHFHQDNLLQEVHTLSITKPQTVRQGTNKDDLEVNMTVEALLVAGAEARTELKPTLDDKKPAPSVLSDRNYDDILKKNFFVGNPIVMSQSTLKEDPNQVFNEVRLTTVSFNGRRWEAYLYHQGKGGDEKCLTVIKGPEFKILDRYENEVMNGKVVYIQDREIVFLTNGKYYKMTVGEYFAQALDKPLKDDEIKAFGLTPPVKATGDAVKKGSDDKSKTVPPPDDPDSPN